MFYAAYPIFEKGRLLKIEMLERLRDYPKEIIDICLKNSKNGIWKGCEIEIKDSYLNIQPGIIFLDGVLYVLKEAYSLPYQSNNRLTLLKVDCMGNNRDKDFIRAISRIYLDFEPNCRENEIELCRFQLREGARLRNDYKDFLDFSTEYDTVNRIFVPYLGKQEITLLPEIFLCFAREMLTYSPLDSLDQLFCFCILQNQGEVEAEVLYQYLKEKKETISFPAANEVYYEKLLQVLQRVSGKRTGIGQQKRKERSILLE